MSDLVNSTTVNELNVKKHATFLVCAKRGVGKSFLCRYLIHQLVLQEKVSVVYCFSPTENVSQSFNCFPPEYIVEAGFDIKFIQSIIDAQKKAIQKFGKEDPRTADVLLVFDDCLGAFNNGSKEAIYLNKLFAISRHYNIGLMILSQATKGALQSPTIRNNIDYLFFSKCNQQQLPSLYESVYWKGNVQSFIEFAYKNMNEPHTFLVYNNTVEKDNWLTIKAPDVGEFRLEYKGCSKAKEKAKAKGCKVSVKTGKEVKKK